MNIGMVLTLVGLVIASISGIGCFISQGKPLWVTLSGIGVCCAGLGCVFVLIM